jgi:hypothetical protein
MDWHDDATWWLWSDLIRLTPARRVPTVAMVLAATAYQRGDTPLALTAAEHAFKADPDFSHTQGILVGLAGGLPADEFATTIHIAAAWARDRIQAQSRRNHT